MIGTVIEFPRRRSDFLAGTAIPTAVPAITDNGERPATLAEIAETGRRTGATLAGAYLTVVDQHRGELPEDICDAIAENMQKQMQSCCAMMGDAGCTSEELVVYAAAWSAAHKETLALIYEPWLRK